MKKLLFAALAVGFLLFGVLAYIKSQPMSKNDRIYKIVKKYSPYYLEKRIGGLQIMSKDDEEFKEKPDNIEVFHRMDQLEREWGQAHLNLKNGTLIIYDNNHTELQKVNIENKNELEFINTFYGVGKMGVGKMEISK